MVGAARLRRQQQEDEVDRIVVDGIEVDGMVETREQGVEAAEPSQPGVGNGDAVADPRGAQPLALEQRVEDLALVVAAKARGVARELLEDLLLAGRLQIGEDAFRRQPSAQCHAASPQSPR